MPRNAPLAMETIPTYVHQRSLLHRSSPGGQQRRPAAALICTAWVPDSTAGECLSAEVATVERSRQRLVTRYVARACHRHASRHSARSVHPVTGRVFLALQHLAARSNPLMSGIWDLIFPRGSANGRVGGWCGDCAVVVGGAAFDGVTRHFAGISH